MGKQMILNGNMNNDGRKVEDYFPFHIHTDMSFLDGFSKPVDYLRRCSELGLKSIGYTEHGNLFSAPYFGKLKKEYPEIKQVIGVELYECFDMSIKDKDSKYFHLIALAKNERGRIALNELITKSNFEGFYYKPRVDIEALKPYTNDLIFTSACLASKLAREKDYDKCVKYIAEYKSIMPHFYIEMQSHKSPDQVEHNKKILKLSQDTDTPFVITCDAHASTEQELYYQNFHVRIAKDNETASEIYEGCYLQSVDEIYETMTPQIGFDNVTKGLQETLNILAMIDDNVSVPFQEPKLPTVTFENQTPIEKMNEIVWEGFESRKIAEKYPNKVQEYKERIKEELDVIYNMGFESYFLIVHDFVKYAKDNGQPVGDARGCFIPDDSFVLMDDCSVKKINEVAIGDKVITHNGNIELVENVLEYDVEEEILDVYFNNNHKISCTQDHEIYIKRYAMCNNDSYKNAYCTERCGSPNACKFKEKPVEMWIKAKDLKIGDYLSYPKINYTFEENVVIDMNSFVSSMDYELRYDFDDDKIWFLFGSNDVKLPPTNRFINIDNDFARFAGYYVCNGWSITKNRRGGFCSIVINNRFKKAIDDVEYLFNKVFGVQPKIEVNEETTILTSHSKMVAIFCCETFGSNSYEKKFPSYIINSNLNLIENALVGIMYTDTCLPTELERRCSFSTSSETLLYQVREMGSRLGFFGSIMRDNRIGLSHSVRIGTDRESEISQKKIAYQYRFSYHSILDFLINNDIDCYKEKTKNKPVNQSFFENNKWLYRFKKLEKRNYVGKVCDLTVKNDSSYIVNGSAVHNSGGGSLVTYLMNITNINPIKYGLIFERFLNKERISYPDLDCDFSDQQSIISYLEGKYGEDNVCRVVNFSYITPKVAIKDVGDVLGIAYNVRDAFSKYFPSSDFDEDYRLNKIAIDKYISENPEYSEWFNIAKNISGKVRQSSIHACAVGIVDSNISQYMPILKGESGERVIQADMKTLEAMGIVKMDVLGIKTLDVVKQTLSIIGKDTDFLDINDDSFISDEKTYELLASGDTDGVFQVESYGMKELFKRLKAKNIGEISDGISLYRPDSMNALEDYLTTKEMSLTPKYIHEDMKPILESTYGKMLYQEQLLDIVKKFGGRTYGGADLFRKGIGKKDIKAVQEESAKLKDEIFINGYSRQIADIISTDLSQKGGYLFNKSHGVGYAMLVYKTAYLKANYPIEYMTSLLNSEIGNFEKLSKYILNAQNMGIDVLPPSINKSSSRFSIADGKILFGINMIKGVGDILTQKILDEREISKFKSFEDFVERVSPDKGSMVAIIKSGMIGGKKTDMLKKYCDSIFESREFTPLVTTSGYTVGRLKDELGIDTKDKEERLKLFNEFKKKEFDLQQKDRLKKHRDEFVEKYMQDYTKWEFNTLSMYLTNNPFKEGLAIIRDFDSYEDGDRVTVIGTVTSIDKKKGKNGQYAFMEFYNGSKTIELILWNNIYAKYSTKILKGSDIAVIGIKSGDKLTVSNARPYISWAKEKGLIK